MTDKIELFCINTGTVIAVDGGTSLAQIANQLAPEMPFRPICARVNNKTESLHYRVFAPKQVEFLPITSASGQRTYVRSLCMVLYRAIDRLYPGSRLRIEHAIAKGYYCRMIGAEASNTPATIERLAAEMRRIIDADIPFERIEQHTADVVEIFRRQGLHDKVDLLETIHPLYTVYYRLDGLCDSYYGALAPSTAHMPVFDLLPYKEGFLLMGFDPENPDVPAQTITQEKMYHAFTDYLDFNSILGVSSVGEINRKVLEGKSQTIVLLAEALHDKYLARISDEILQRYRQGGARIVLISGPSSSGKTTTTMRLAIQLTTNLLKPQMLSLDDYFVDRQHTPRDADGDYDYESLYALDIKQFNSDLQRILAGEDVQIPTYNFQTGRREYNGKHICLSDNSVLLIEGIHGLNPELTRSIPENQKYRIYVSALTTISIDDHNWVPTTDNRLLRRIIRDHKYRGASAIDTIRRWPSVRRGEEKWIFPYQENADATFNSSLLFELGVMKQRGEEILRGVSNDVPEYAEAYRLLKFLSYFVGIDESIIPRTSLLREFLGGSAFHY